jgi:hypothetical protein
MPRSQLFPSTYTPPHTTRLVATGRAVAESPAAALDHLGLGDGDDVDGDGVEL